MGCIALQRANICFCTLVLSLRAFFLSENFTSESVLSIGCEGSLSLEA